jgi:DNA-binding protein H-NS
MSDTEQAAGNLKRKPSGHDLDRLTVPELAALRDAAEAKRLEKLDEAKKALLDEFREKAAQIGVSLDSLLPGKAPARAGRASGQKTLAVKYRGPKGEEWRGRGKTPDWLREAEKQGRKREEFRV